MINHSHIIWQLETRKLIERLIKWMLVAVKSFLTRGKQTQVNHDFKSILMEEAFLERNIPCQRISGNLLIVTVNHIDYLFQNMNGPTSTAAIRIICNEKMAARQLFHKAGLNIPQSLLLRLSDRPFIIAFAEKIGFPVVVKPKDSSKGRGVFTHIYDGRSLFRKVDELRFFLGGDGNAEFIIEKQFEGNDYRFFVLNKKVLAVTLRKRPNVIGDGESNVITLIEKKNMLRKKNRYLKDHLIPTNKYKLERLFREGKSLQYVPSAGETVYLRDQSNLSGGGDSVDMTDETHLEFKKMAVRAVSCVPGMNYGGVDIIATSVTSKPDQLNHIVTEIEFSPGPVSMFPIQGKPRDMAGAIIDFYRERI